MSQLIEYKSKYYHYYQDDQGRYHGEYKWWNSNGQLRQHCSYKDGKRYGEYKWWWMNGQLEEHSFYKDNINITDEVKELVSDIKNITHKEKVLIKLTYGIECI